MQTCGELPTLPPGSTTCNSKASKGKRAAKKASKRKQGAAKPQKQQVKHHEVKSVAGVKCPVREAPKMKMKRERPPSSAELLTLSDEAGEFIDCDLALRDFDSALLGVLEQNRCSRQV